MSIFRIHLHGNKKA
ncbi:hypothetical protein [Escherichia coli]|nr:hypothetical protein [Escherichia coli]MCX0053224.1 hypothetical protein [Escherichia coli]